MNELDGEDISGIVAKGFEPKVDRAKQIRDVAVLTCEEAGLTSKTASFLKVEFGFIAGAEWADLNPIGRDSDLEYIKALEAEILRLNQKYDFQALVKRNEELDLQNENLSALLRQCFRWAKNREPQTACIKIAELSDKSQHLLTEVSVFRVIQNDPA